MENARLTGINEWYTVHIATVGFVAAFRNEQDAQDYANAIRDSIGEARGLTSAVTVKCNS